MSLGQGSQLVRRGSPHDGAELNSIGTMPHLPRVSLGQSQHNERLERVALSAAATTAASQLLARHGTVAVKLKSPATPRSPVRTAASTDRCDRPPGTQHTTPGTPSQAFATAAQRISPAPQSDAGETPRPRAGGTGPPGQLGRIRSDQTAIWRSPATDLEPRDFGPHTHFLSGQFGGKGAAGFAGRAVLAARVPPEKILPTAPGTASPGRKPGTARLTRQPSFPFAQFAPGFPPRPPATREQRSAPKSTRLDNDSAPSVPTPVDGPDLAGSLCLIPSNCGYPV